MANTMSPEAWQAYLAEDCSWFTLRCSIAAIAMVVVAYVGRFWARSLQAAPWGWFDWLMIPGFLGTLGTSVCGILASQWGTGRHIEWLYYQPDAVLDRWGLMAYYISAVVYMVGIAFPRFSILCLYGRLFRDKVSKVGIWLVLVLLVARMIVEAPILLLQCKHLDSAWRIERWEPDCSSQLLRHYTYSRISNIVADVIMLVLPLPPLLKLNLALDVKLGIITTFSLGAFGLATAVAGFVIFVENINSFDQSWIDSSTMSWSVLEPAVYFTSACMLTYKPLIRSITRIHTIQILISRRSMFVDGLDLPPPNGNYKESSLPSSKGFPKSQKSQTVSSSEALSPVLKSFHNGYAAPVPQESSHRSREARSPATASFHHGYPTITSPASSRGARSPVTPSFPNGYPTPTFQRSNYSSRGPRSPALASFQNASPMPLAPTSSRQARSPAAALSPDNHPVPISPRSNWSAWFQDNDGIERQSRNNENAGQSWLEL